MENDPSEKSAKHAILNLVIKDKQVLYNAYMPFLKSGGLFVPTDKAYQLGDEVFLLVSLLEEPEKLPVAAKVVWITPKGAQGNKVPGIGVEFHNDENQVRAKIESILAGMLKAETVTHTM